jgi:hypothetical protein
MGIYHNGVYVTNYSSSTWTLANGDVINVYMNNDPGVNVTFDVAADLAETVVVKVAGKEYANWAEGVKVAAGTMVAVETAGNVYVNGVLLEKSDYAVFDNNKIMIAFDLVGGQEILPIHKGDYAHPYRVIADGELKFIECEGDDEVLIEVRDDLTLKKRTYPIKDVSYETYSFDILDYDYPVSLSQTKDVIKIYINGVLYDGDYTNIEGVITLLECSLEEDPLYKYLRMNPSMMKEYEEKYGEYIKHEDTITFEWR